LWSRALQFTSDAMGAQLSLDCPAVRGACGGKPELTVSWCPGFGLEP